MKFVFLILTALVALSACSNKSEEKAVVGNVMLYAPPKPMQKVSSADDWDDTPAGQSLSDTSHKIIKTGEIIFETSNLKDKRKRIIRVLSALNGYVSEDNQNFNHEYNRQEFIMEVRLPSRKFDLLIDSVETGVDKIDSKTISVKDVTTQFIDIKTALANKRTLENTYLSLLNKANKISDVLAIENKLTQIRTTIDSTQGELNYLRKQVAYSSIKITMYGMRFKASF
jgi:hypothetical protein